MYEIEKGIPIPEKSPSVAQTVKMLEVGDSFVLHNEQIPPARCAASRFGYKTVSQKIDNNNVRLWRSE